MIQLGCISLILVLFLLQPTKAHANMVWPALYLEIRLCSWWAVLVGLLVEYLFVRWLFKLPPLRALWADILANTFSTIVGILLIPLAGIVWELFPGSLYMWIFNWGTFNPLTWLGTILIASFINTLLERLVYKKIFHLNIGFKQKEFRWLFIANFLTVVIAFASLWIMPLEL